MPTGYEVGFYRDVERLREAAESIAKSLEKLAVAADKTPIPATPRRGPS